MKFFTANYLVAGFTQKVAPERAREYTELMSVCRKDSRGKHKPRVLGDFGNPDKVRKVICRNCGQILVSEEEQTDEQKAF